MRKMPTLGAKGHNSYFQKDSLGVGERRILELNETLHLRVGEGEEDHLIPQVPLKEPLDDEVEEEALPQPKGEAVEGGCLPPFKEERFDNNLICESSFTWVITNNSLRNAQLVNF